MSGLQVPPEHGDAPLFQHKRESILFAVATAVIITGLYFYGTSGFPLAEPDETRYAEIPREMIVTGDWITPRLNFVKYLEKPPLVYWGSGLAYLLFGVNEMAARVPVVLAGLGTIALTAALAANTFGPTVAVLAATILATSPFFAFMGIVLILDMPLTFFVTLGYTAAWFGSERKTAIGHRVTWVAAALGILTKGPIAAVLIAAGVVPYLFWREGWRGLRRAIDLPGFLLATAIVLPWFVAVSWRNPEFVGYFIVDQHFTRFVEPAEHTEPIWFFLPLLPLLLLPWSFAPAFALGSWRNRLAQWPWSPPTVYLSLWAVTTIGFFSLSGSKLVTYVLPAVPPLAILLAHGMIATATAMQASYYRRMGAGIMVLGIATSVVGAVLPYFVAHPRVDYLQPYLAGGGLAVAAAAFVLYRFADRPRWRLPLLTACLLVFLAFAMSGRGVTKHYDELALAATAEMTPQERLAVYRHLVPGVTFHARRRVVMVEDWGEIEFGRRQGRHDDYFWKTTERLREEWRKPERLFLVINRKELAALDPPLEPHRILAEQGRKVLIVNRPPLSNLDSTTDRGGLGGASAHFGHDLAKNLDDAVLLIVP